MLFTFLIRKERERELFSYNPIIPFVSDLKSLLKGRAWTVIREKAAWPLFWKKQGKMMINKLVDLICFNHVYALHLILPLLHSSHDSDRLQLAAPRNVPSMSSSLNYNRSGRRAGNGGKWWAGACQLIQSLSEAGQTFTRHIWRTRLWYTIFWLYSPPFEFASQFGFRIL